jgi:Protein of unknown function (DUF1275)/AMP-binding enzyme C-terminal domain
MAAALAMIAGFLDAYGIITYNTYLSFMSGNTTQAGYRAGQGDFGAVVHSALAIVFFVGGSFAGALLAYSAVRVPDPKYGEEVEAAVVLKGNANPEALRSYCREQLADFKVPKVIRIVSELPMNATGKVDRRALATLYPLAG